MDIFIIVPLLGIVAGLLSGLLGIGGGIVIVPALIYLLPSYVSVPSENIPLVAIATSLATIIVTTYSSAKSHYDKGGINWNVTIPVAFGVAFMAILAPFLAALMGGKNVTLFFALILLVLALQMVISAKKVVTEEQLPGKGTLILGGMLTGFIASIAGLGGGAILVPYLTYAKVVIHKAIATAAACGIVVASFGTIGFLITHLTTYGDLGQHFHFLGYMHWPTALGIMLFSYFSAPYGVKLSHKLDQKQLKKVFAVFMMVVATRMIWQQI